MCTVLWFLLAPVDNKASFSHRLLLWTSGKLWSQQELSGALSFTVCKTLTFQTSPQLQFWQLCVSCVYLTSRTWQLQPICCDPPTKCGSGFGLFYFKAKNLSGWQRRQSFLLMVSCLAFLIASERCCLSLAVVTGALPLTSLGLLGPRKGSVRHDHQAHDGFKFG